MQSHELWKDVLSGTGWIWQQALPALKLQWNSIKKKKLLLTNPNNDTSKLQFYTGPVQVPKDKSREHQSNYTLSTKEDFLPIITIWHTISGASLDLGNPVLGQGLCLGTEPAPLSAPSRVTEHALSIPRISIFYLFFDYVCSLTVCSKLHAKSQSIIR